MGFDCTLHLVDENRIRQEFVPALLREGAAPECVREAREDADALFDQVRGALAGDDPVYAARLVGQLAIVYSACFLPHRYERGVALSLWSHFDGGPPGDLPAQLCTPPDVLFAELFAQYPALAGLMPTQFDGNYCTGMYVPAPQVAEMLGWVRARLAERADGRRRPYRGLERVLEVAAERGLGYWEATDISVTQSQREWLHRPLRAGVNLTPWPDGMRAREGFVGGGTFVVPGDSRSARIDLADPSLEPTVWEVDLPTDLAAVGDAEFAVLRVRDSRPYRFPVFRSSGEGAPAEIPASDGASLNFGAVFASEGELFGIARSNAGATLHMLRDDKWAQVPMPEIEPIKAGFSKRYVFGHGQLQDGNAVLVWGTDVYERQGERWLPRWRPGFHRPERQIELVSGPDEGLFFLDERRLCFAPRGTSAPVQKLLPEHTNVMGLAAGPSGGLLLRFGDNPAELLVGACDPATQELSAIRRDELIGPETGFCYGIAWSDAAERVLVATEAGLFTFPWSFWMRRA